MRRTMQFCTECGHDEIVQKIPDGDKVPREVCAGCGAIFYQNPNIVAACIATWQEQILLCQRDIEPRADMWTIPGGFMENGESIREAALREAREEACAKIDEPELFSIHNLIYNQQVYVIYRGVLVDGAASAGDETKDVKLVAYDEVVWDDIAFSVVSDALHLYLEDIKRGSFRVHQADMLSRDEPPQRY